MTISNVRFSSAPASDVDSGLLGWLSFDLDDLRLDSVALRRTTHGRLTLSFPSRRDSSGRRHHIVRPVDDDARQEIERQIIAAIRIGDGS